MRRILLIITVILISLLLVSLVVSAVSDIEIVSKVGDGTWTGNTWEVSMFPAETKTTTLNFHNFSSESIEVGVTINPDSFDGGNLLLSLSKSAFTLLGKDSIKVTLSAKANGSIAPGIYTSVFTIEEGVVPVFDKFCVLHWWLSQR